MQPTAAELFGRHYRAIYGYLRRMTGNRHDAEDLTQDVFLKVVSALPQYESRDRESAWLFRIARNVFLNHRRTVSRHPESPEAAEHEAVSPAPQLLGAVLRESFDRLAPADREVVLLHDQGGLSYEEIGSLCAMTEAAVRSRIFRARCALRADLAADLRALRGER